MKTKGLLNKNCIVLDMHPTSKENAIQILVDRIADEYKIENREAILATVLNREKLASTGVEAGIALPHAKTSFVSELHIAVGIVKEGVDFHSIDNKPAKIIVLMLTPLKSESSHVLFLASITSLLSKAEVREKLINAENVETVMEALSLVC